MTALAIVIIGLLIKCICPMFKVGRGHYAEILGKTFKSFLTVKAKQHCTRGGEGANLFLLDTMVAWHEIENCIEMSQQFCLGL